jgi:hypothetical protein
MGHHSNGFLTELVAYGFAAFLPISVIGLMVGAAWEAHKRKHGRTAKPGSSRETVGARFSVASE